MGVDVSVNVDGVIPCGDGGNTNNVCVAEGVGPIGISGWPRVSFDGNGTKDIGLKDLLREDCDGACDELEDAKDETDAVLGMRAEPDGVETT